MNARAALLTCACLAVLVLNAAAVTRYVDLNSPSPTPPYTNWPTAATNIQDAVDAADAGDTVLVTNGVYETGGRVAAFITNRVVVTKPLIVQSVNGPSATTIRGYQIPGSTNGFAAVRCVYLTNGAVLAGFTLTSGATSIVTPAQPDSGGGVFCASTSATVSNCVLTGNSAYAFGGGAYSGTLNNCILMGNSASSGGGAYSSTLRNCVVASNTAAANGGGAYLGTAHGCVFLGNTAQNGGGFSGSDPANCTIVGNVATVSGGGVNGGGSGAMQNCIVYYNTAPSRSNYANIKMNYCCTMPMSALDTGTSNPPVFAGLIGGDLRLQSNSPCINAGNNVYVTSATDLDGNPRISGGTVDIGAYEFQSPGSVLSYAWAQRNGLPTDGTADFTDADGDGANNWHEWRADTVPTNSASALLMGTATNGVTGLVVSWASVATRRYRLERTGDLGAVPVFQTIATNLPGVAGVKTFNDTSATNGGPYFYRVGVQ